MAASPPPRRRRPAAGAPPAKPRGQADAASAAEQAQSITASLLNTKNMMSQELHRVSNLNTTIQDDGALLHGAKEEHAGMKGTMKGARGVMRRLGRQDVRDAIILRCAIVFYWVVVAYVLWSRIKVPFLP